jgi:hydroxyacylglutathione hydrolase
MTEARLYLRQIELGPMQNFVYLVGDQASRECVVVDPAWEIEGIVDLAARDDMRLVGALVTHTHQDHVGGHLFGHDIPGVEDLLGTQPMKVYVHRAEREFLKGFGSDLVQVQGGDTLQVGAMTVTFVHTPGHTPGSQCFLVDGCLISGDTLFIRSCGRTDLPGSDPAEMYTSLTQRLGALPEDTVVLPGHNYGGSQTTIGAEKRENPMMRFPSMSDFLRVMGGGRVGSR